MNYYIPSYKNSRLKLKRNRRPSKKPLLLFAVIMTVVLSYFLVGLDFKRSEVPGKSSKLTLKDPQSPLSADQPYLKESGESLKDVHQDDPNILHEEKTVSVSAGDTLMGLLTREGLARAEAHTVITTLEEVFNPRRLRQDHEIVLAFETMEDYDPLFQTLNLKLDVTREVQVARCPENGFVAQEIVRELQAKPARAEAEITSSLYNAAVSAGIPVDVLMQMIRAYSFDVDFQRDIRPGDAFEVLFEEQFDDNGNFVRGGSVLYASLNTRGRDLAIYRYETRDGEVDFFNDKGQSVRKTLMVTPIDGARLSSGYGMRRHPILGYSRMHQGLDFAAPTGTPIMAAGDGVVEFAGRRGNYGNVVTIRHPNEYQTLYAHMSRFASGIRSGARVRQGETIGYVGATGMATGPHLHYEVHHRGSHVNPATVETPPGRTLKGDELERFHTARRDLKTLFASLEKREKLARLE
ncbi:M23 family metallopeptidase [Desulfonatronovibrio hydrogenovorans]|uniref:M23 family metallopeptidase n=1 Tax=Desulfonatronovibrio hydrogenovorans TaxID=53245 RepID=UPI00068BDF5A|nr:M23 family metallopeptidase [Desulfonatronovibrio hydrogenovorans]